MSNRVGITRSGSVYFDAASKESQPALGELLKAVCKTRYRRIDRFTELALLGAGRCASDVLLSPDTALYLASGTGPAGINIAMQEHIVRDKLLPSPIQFIKSVTNSASFYVMKDHGLSGQNLFVSRQQHSFEAALQLALLDILARRSQQVLVGIVEEITYPLVHQYQRIGLNSDVKLGEGSHWLLLSDESSGEKLATLEQASLHASTEDFLESLEVLSKLELGKTYVYFSEGVASDLVCRILNLFGDDSEHVHSSEGHWDGQVAGVIIEYITSGVAEPDIHIKPARQFEAERSRLITVGIDSEKRFHTLVVTKPGF